MTTSTRWKRPERIRLVSSVFGLDRATRRWRREAEACHGLPVHFRQAMTFSIEHETSRRSHHHHLNYIHASFSKMKGDTRSVTDVLRNDALQYRSSDLVSFFVEA